MHDERNHGADPPARRPSPLTVAARLAMAASFAVCGATVLALMLLAHPNGDDFCRATLTPIIPIGEWTASPDAIAYSVDSWRYWTGRWAAMLVEPAVLTRVDLQNNYAPLVIANGVAILLALMFLCNRVFGGRIWLPFGAVLATLFWSGMPSPADGLFWFTGSFENVFAASAVGLVVGLTTIIPASRGRRLAMAITAGVLGFIVPGLHELAGGCLLAILITGVVVTSRGPSDVRAAWTISAVTTAAGFVVATIAPGNDFRAAMYPARDLSLAFRLTAEQLLDYGPRWSLSVPLLSASVAFVLTAPWRSARAHWTTYFAGPRKWLVPAVTAGLVVTCLFLPAYTLSRHATTRTADIAYLVFLTGWFGTLLVAGPSSSLKGVSVSRMSGLASASLIVLAASVVYGGNTREGIGDLRHRAAEWHVAMDERWARVAAFSGRTDDVAVDRVPRWPRLYLTGEIEESASGFRNRCIAGYFGVAGVVLRPESGKENAVAERVPTG